MYFFFYIFDRWSVAKLTGSMFCLCIFVFYIFDRWSDVKLTGLCGWSWVAFGASVGGLETVLGPLWAVLGRSRGLCGRSWAFLVAMLAVLECPWGLCWRSWAALGVYVRDTGPCWGVCWRSPAVLGPLFGAMLAVLVRSWDLCWRSWPLLEPLLAVLGRLGLKNAEEYEYL